VSGIRGEGRRAARAGVLLVVAGGVTGVLNLLFNVVVARGGGASVYGAIGALLTVVTVVGIVATGFQYGIARRAALSTRGLAELIGPTLRSVAPWAAGALVVVAIFWPLSGFLKLHSVVPALLIAALAAVSVFAAAVSGLLVGFRLFKVIAGLGVGSAVLRLGLGFLVGRGSAAVELSLVVSVVAGVATLLGGLLLLAVAARRIPTSSGAPGGTTRGPSRPNPRRPSPRGALRRSCAPGGGCAVGGSAASVPAASWCSPSWGLAPR
jgi:O-antigen/teichoic acid export membrane protein